MLLRQYQNMLQPHEIEVTGTDLIIDDDHTFRFTLSLKKTDGSSLISVSGTFADEENYPFSKATWGGLSVLEDDTLAVYTKQEILFFSLRTLAPKAPSFVLPDYQDAWILGVCSTKDGYVAAIGGADVSCIVYLDAAGNITKTVAADDPAAFREREINYFTREDSYTAGLALTTFPKMQTMRFDAPDREMILLDQNVHSSWAAIGDAPGGQLESFLFFDPATGMLIYASEDFYHTEGNKRYSVLSYTSDYPVDPTGYIGVYYENDARKIVVSFAGPPSYLTYEIEEVAWTVDGPRVQAVNPYGSQYISLDFEKLTGSAQYRFTQADLTDRVLATAPNGRYSLQAVNMNGAGDGYWGQVVLMDHKTGQIRYVCNMPLRYGADAQSTRFCNNSYFTTSSGQTLGIHSIDTPDQYRTVELSLPEEQKDVIYCNSLYDIQNNRYLLVYLDQVEVDSGGWHNYENAVYHVAVFDSTLKMVKDVAVPALKITHELYAMPCPDMAWDGAQLTLDNIPVAL